MSVKELTFAESTQMALSTQASASVLLAGLDLFRGRSDEEADLSTWLTAIKPNVRLINDAIRTRFVIEGDLPVPIGLSVITGKAGSGKTRFINESMIPRTPDSLVGKVLRIGEPGYFAPYTLRSLLGVIEAAVSESVKLNKPGIMYLDSLLSSWFDPSITDGFATGRGGASLGVPMLLQLLGQYTLSQGYRLVTVLHPVFADPEVIGSGISGVSSLFVNKDTNAFIVRDYEEIPEDIAAEDGSVVALNYRRREMNFEAETDTGVSLLARNIGDED